MLVRATSVTCFAGITSSIFSSLPKKKQDFILTSAVNATLNDEVSSIKSVVCRAIGEFKSYGAEILGKFIHAANITTSDPLVLVIFLVSSICVKYMCWALANICDSLHHCINVVTSKRCFVDVKVASHLIVLLIECSLRLTNGDKDVALSCTKWAGGWDGTALPWCTTRLGAPPGELCIMCIYNGVDMFGKRVGFFKFNADVIDKATGKKVLCLHVGSNSCADPFRVR
ncbi:hypothetical protein LOK49_LG05G01960 [Camellia lanceoleosa]|uniref:Uncharacterized protein n=1 Tax=Camellia lanceoleosa TaxID=1840588 RepID=A0ACC0HQ21_9ERIC|nr:hypothetical protein LOK49_LG05G01960 [Camellia lanceoleosa]